ncbi:MAG: hypothetical protein J7K72_05260 [Candidatus Aenigmarchaeota archaeon]|nr:hypothetical protein [Candidatus Aenigmarchaeota archaeon]
MKKGLKIPKKDVVIFVIREVMKRHNEVNSLSELKGFVDTRLKRVDQNLSISGKRLRRIFSEISDMKMIIETKRSKKAFDRCPSCSHVLKMIYTKNLKGKKILYKLVCEKCGYSAANGKWMPRRYRFIKL